VLHVVADGLDRDAELCSDRLVLLAARDEGEHLRLALAQSRGQRRGAPVG
jgi:hypothetical protein